MSAAKFLDRFILIAGGAEMLVGGIMAAVPTLFPQWVAWICAGVGALTVLYGIFRVREDIWEWLYKKAVERQQNVNKKKDDPLDVVLAKRDLTDFVQGSLSAGYHAIHEAVRVGAHVYEANWKDNDSSKIAFWGIQSRIPDRTRMHILLDKEKIREWQLENLQGTLVESLARYCASCEMLNLVCEAMNRTGRYEDKRNYTQKDNKNFYVLVQEWWVLHKKLKDDLYKLASKGDFSHLRYSVFEKKVLDRPGISERVFKTFIEHHQPITPA